MWVGRPLGTRGRGRPLARLARPPEGAAFSGPHTSAPGVSGKASAGPWTRGDTPGVTRQGGGPGVRAKEAAGKELASPAVFGP